MDDTTLRKWMGHEAGKMNAGLVRQRRPLHELLHEHRPSAPTQTGTHTFDSACLARLQEILPPLVSAAALLQFQLYVSHEDPADAYTTDARTAEALQALGLRVSPLRAGRHWISLALLHDLMKTFPTVLQLVRV